VAEVHIHPLAVAELQDPEVVVAAEPQEEAGVIDRTLLALI
jgi:hypothetical protein